MMEVRTFTTQMRPLHVHRELTDLDAQVNDFLKQNDARLLSVSDTATTGFSGETLGIIPGHCLREAVDGDAGGCRGVALMVT